MSGRRRLSDALLAPDVQFRGPASARVIVGADAMRTQLSAQFGVTKDIRIQRHIAADKHAVMLFDFGTVHGARRRACAGACSL